jgi:hypothetical protein
MSNSMSLQKNQFQQQFNKVMNQLARKFSPGNCTLGEKKSPNAISMFCIEGQNQNETTIKGGMVSLFPQNEFFSYPNKTEIDCVVNGYANALNECVSKEGFDEGGGHYLNDNLNNITFGFNDFVNAPCVGNFLANSTIDLQGLSAYGCPYIPPTPTPTPTPTPIPTTTPMPITNSDPWLIVGFVVLGITVIGGMTIIDRWKNESRIANSIGGAFQSGYTKVKGAFTSGHVDGGTGVITPPQVQVSGTGDNPLTQPLNQTATNA